jgi:hypothetical protein
MTTIEQAPHSVALARLWTRSSRPNSLADVFRFIGGAAPMGLQPSSTLAAGRSLWPTVPAGRNLRHDESAPGLVSRVTPLHTAMRNCTRDEGWPFEVGNQVLISSHRKLLSSKAMVVNVAEKSERRFRQA